MADNSNLESQFNMAFAYLQRIDKLLYFCQQSALAKNADKWTDYVRAVYREASVRMNEEEMHDVLGTHYKIDDDKIKKFKIHSDELNFRLVYYMLNNPTFKIHYRHVLLYILDGLEVKLRTILQLKGMLLPSKRDPTKAIINI